MSINKYLPAAVAGTAAAGRKVYARSHAYFIAIVVATLTVGA